MQLQGDALWLRPVEEQFQDEIAFAWEHWMQRDALFAQWIANEAKGLNLRVIQIDGNLSLETTANIVENWFMLKDEGRAI